MNQTLNRLMTRENAWIAFGFLAAFAGDALSRALIKASWRATTGEEPPQSPGAEKTSLGHAIAWGITTGALVGLVRALSRRGANNAWRRWS